MQPLEETMVDLLERGERLTASHFGGVDALISNGRDIIASPFGAEFLSALVSEEPPSKSFDAVAALAAEIILAAEDDIGLNEMLDTASQAHHLGDAAARRLFEGLVSKTFDRRLPASFRTAALRGALLFASGSSQRLAKLAGELSYHGCQDDLYFMAHAVRIAGLLYANEPSSGLRDLISESLSIPEVADQSHFELGMIAFRDAADETSLDEVALNLAAAQSHFTAALEQRSSRHDAAAFGAAIGVLRAFYDGTEVSDLETASAVVGEAASNFYSYNASEGWEFDRGRAVQVAALTSVSRKVAALSSSLTDPTWLDGAAKIENELVEAYCANRSVLGGNPDGGLGVILRPRIERGVGSNPHLAGMVQLWLTRFAGAPPTGLEPLAQVVAGALDTSRSFTEATSGQPSFVAVIGRLRSSDAAGAEELATAIEQSAMADAAHTSDNIKRLLAEIGTSFDGLVDFQGDARARFLMIVWKLLLFIEHRLDSTAAQDPGGAYLFRRPGETKPLEKHLQADILAFLRRTKIPVGDEIRGVGGGRADVEVKIDRHRFIIEVKRELSDGSFENIMLSYGGQAKTYQATNVKLGFLFVLDLSKTARSTPDIENCIQIRRGVLFGDDIDRGMVLLRMPGNRIPPSAS